MSDKCRHRKNVTIYEESLTELGFEFYEGGQVSDFAGESRPTGKVSARCNDCGRLIRVGKGERLPRWAKILWESIHA